MELILVQLCLLAFAAAVRLDFKHQNCTLYLKKLGVANNTGGTGSTRIYFAGDVFIQEDNLEVQVGYSDKDLFYDPIYFGLVQEDGKTAQTTCLDLKLWQFTSNSFSNPVQITDLPIRGYENYLYRWRIYSFTIPNYHLRRRLIQTTNCKQFIYKGYYAIAFYAAGTDEVIFTFYFEISVTTNHFDDFLHSQTFKSLSQSSTAHCTLKASCNEKADTVLNWCTDLTCTSFTTPDLHFKDQFILQQVVTTAGMDYYLNRTEVWYTGYGLNNQAFLIKSINNSKKGQVIIQLEAEIVWSAAVIIRVTSTLSTTQLDTSSYFTDKVNGETQEISCIKAKGEEECPTSEQQEWITGFWSYDCKEDEVHQSSIGLGVQSFCYFFILICCCAMCTFRR